MVRAGCGHNGFLRWVHDPIKEHEEEEEERSCCERVPCVEREQRMDGQLARPGDLLRSSDEKVVHVVEIDIELRWRRRRRRGRRWRRARWR